MRALGGLLLAVAVGLLLLANGVLSLLFEDWNEAPRSLWIIYGSVELALAAGFGYVGLALLAQPPRARVWRLAILLALEAAAVPYAAMVASAVGYAANLVLGLVGVALGIAYVRRGSRQPGRTGGPVL